MIYVGLLIFLLITLYLNLSFISYINKGMGKTEVMGVMYDYFEPREIKVPSILIIFNLLCIFVTIGIYLLFLMNISEEYDIIFFPSLGLIALFIGTMYYSRYYIIKKYCSNNISFISSKANKEEYKDEVLKLILILVISKTSIINVLIDAILIGILIDIL